MRDVEKKVKEMDDKAKKEHEDRLAREKALKEREEAIESREREEEIEKALKERDAKKAKDEEEKGRLGLRDEEKKLKEREERLKDQEKKLKEEKIGKEKRDFIKGSSNSATPPNNSCTSSKKTNVNNADPRSSDFSESQSALQSELKKHKDQTNKLERQVDVKDMEIAQQITEIVSLQEWKKKKNGGLR